MRMGGKALKRAKPNQPEPGSAEDRNKLPQEKLDKTLCVKHVLLWCWRISRVDPEECMAINVSTLSTGTLPGEPTSPLQAARSENAGTRLFQSLPSSLLLTHPVLQGSEVRQVLEEAAKLRKDEPPEAVPLHFTTFI
ncbi:hypothetical protein F2P79_024160 [Pimephales promelas]|nr:hypothetical protein F2P79_024160 [Pimephales promelas]